MGAGGACAKIWCRRGQRVGRTPFVTPKPNKNLTHRGRTGNAEFQRHAVERALALTTSEVSASPTRWSKHAPPTTAVFFAWYALQGV
jgi:hypothetical protein